MRATVIAAVLGGVMTYIGVRTMPLNALAYALAFAGCGALAAGWVARRRGPLVGVAAMLIGAALWYVDVLIRSWSEGQLARQSPDCDPCGLGGYSVRMAIVVAIAAPYFLPVGAVAGWLGASLRARVASR